MEIGSIRSTISANSRATFRRPGGLVFPARRPVFEYRGLGGVEVAVEDGDDGIGYFAEVGDGQHAGVGELLPPWQAGQHVADVAVEQHGPFAAANPPGQLRRMGVDVVGIVGGRHGGHVHRGDVQAAGVVDEGIIRLFGDPLLPRPRRLRLVADAEVKVGDLAEAIVAGLVVVVVRIVVHEVECHERVLW
ncbi:hypothetical protein [Corynebacterium xerosis]|uniref:hypothetical protein n=1 Tax=Corynebacterium xerosis TaxID=1725 RepID=UPI00366B8CD1